MTRGKPMRERKTTMCSERTMYGNAMSLEPNEMKRALLRVLWGLMRVRNPTTR